MIRSYYVARLIYILSVIPFAVRAYSRGNWFGVIFWCISPIVLLIVVFPLIEKVIWKAPYIELVRLLSLRDEVLCSRTFCSLVTFPSINKSDFWTKLKKFLSIIIIAVHPLFHVIAFLDKLGNRHHAFIPGVLYLTNYRLLFCPCISTKLSGFYNIFLAAIIDIYPVCSKLGLYQYIVIKTLCHEEWFLVNDPIEIASLINERICSEKNGFLLTDFQSYIADLGFKIDESLKSLSEFAIEKYGRPQNECIVNNNEEYKMMAHVRMVQDLAMVQWEKEKQKPEK